MSMIQIVRNIKEGMLEQLREEPSISAPWGAVTSLNPLMVRLEGVNLTASGPVPNNPINVGTNVSGLRIGDRVQILLERRRATIIGINGGMPPDPMPDIGWTTVSAVSGITGSLKVRRVSGIVIWGGAVGRTAGWSTSYTTAAVVGSIPTWARPSTADDTNAVLAAGSTTHHCLGVVNGTGLQIASNTPTAWVRVKALSGYASS